MNHVHSWRRFSETKFLCTGPTCWVRADLKYHDKKVAKCPTCHEHFILQFHKIKKDTELVTCENCGDKEYEPATIEEIQKILKQVASETYKPVYSDKLAEIQQRNKMLDIREAQLNETQKRLNALDDKLSKLKWTLDKRQLFHANREARIEKRYARIKEIIRKFREETKPPVNIIPQPGVTESIEDILKRELSK